MDFLDTSSGPSGLFLSDNWDLTSYEQVAEGKRWNFPYLREMDDNHRLFNNDMNPLFNFNDDSIENGMYYFKNIDNIVRINFFSAITDFFVDAMFSLRPKMIGSSQQQQKWIDDNNEEIFRRLEEAERFRSITGRYALIVENNELRAIDGRYYFPIRDLYDRERTRKHLIVYTANDDKAWSDYATPLETLGWQIKNRMKIIYYDPDNNISEWEERELVGGIEIGKIIDKGPSNIQGMWTYEDDTRGDYTAVKEILKEIMLRYSMIKYSFNANSMPDRQGPTDWKDNFTRDRLGMVWGLNENDKDITYITYDGNEATQMEYVENLWELVHINSGVPRNAFGVGESSAGESGVAIAERMTKAVSKVERLRKEVELWLPDICYAMGCPQGDIDIMWLTAPLESKQKAHENYLNMFEKGAIDVYELRALMGIEEMVEQRTGKKLEFQEDKSVNNFGGNEQQWQN